MKTYSKKKFILVINKINKNLIKKNLLNSKQKILIAFSGGQDSFCLFLVFYQLKNQWNYQLNFIYCNHLWQIESFYIKKNSFKLFYLFKLFFLVVIPSKKILNEEKARKWRFNCFKRIKFFYQYNTILTGHTGSDRLETLIFNFFRGSSPEGLLSLKFEFNSFKNNIIFCNFYFFKRIHYKILKVFLSNRKKQFYQKKKLFFKICHFVKIPSNHRFENILKKNYLIPSSFGLRTSVPFPKGKKSKFEKKFYYFLNKNFFFRKIKKYKIYFLKNFYVTSFLKKRPQRQKNYFLKNKALKTESFLITSKNPKKDIILEYLNYLKFYYSIKKYKKYKIVRPFLYLNRFDTKVLSCSLKLPIYNDKSNENINFFRNRIRKQIFPVFRFFFNPQIDNLFFQFLDLIELEQIYFNFLIKRLKKNILKKKNGIVILNLSLFKKLPKTLQGKFLQKMIKFFIDKKIKFYHLNCLLKEIKKKKFSKDKLIFTYNKKILFFEKCIYCPEIGIIYISSFFLIIFLNKKVITGCA
uniref:tRNA(Ile)-lysidine synthase, chloroplastic n=1 Tax=Gloeotilopsis sterilis TaxID=160069 RepID=A0A097KNN2_GLOST|nr:hypothetical chloroplast RF62 [Gloeotilopsis sterilis]AIT94814.1 hypothetical chloroplast RF62 [Gloeotilopsis sterilis]